MTLWSWDPDGWILNAWCDVIEVRVQPTVLWRVVDGSNWQAGLIGPGAIVAPLVALVVGECALPQCEQEIGRLNTAGSNVALTVAGGVSWNAELFPWSCDRLLCALFGLEVVLVLDLLVVQVEDIVGLFVRAECELFDGSLALIDVVIVVAALESELF